MNTPQEYTHTHTDEYRARVDTQFGSGMLCSLQNELIVENYATEVLMFSISTSLHVLICAQENWSVPAGQLTIIANEDCGVARVPCSSNNAGVWQRTLAAIF